MPLLNHIDGSLVGYTPDTPAFLQLVTDELGNLGDPSDGFDAALGALILGAPATDSQFDSESAAFTDLAGATEVLNALDASDLVLDFGEGVPVIDSFAYNLQLQGVGTLQLPALPAPPTGGPPLPAPPPTVCVPAPAPPPVTCVPAPPGPPGLPPPLPIPGPAPCPPGFVSSPTGCQPSPAPCPSGMNFTSGQCTEPTPPTSGGGVGPIIPPIIILPPSNPCPSGFTSTAGDCTPQSNPDIPLPIIPITGIGAGGEGAGTLGTILGAPGIAGVLATTIPEVLIAFILFNAIFSGNFDAEMAKYAAQIAAFEKANPLAFTVFSLEQALNNLQQQLNAPALPPYERTQVQQQYDRLKQQLTDALNALQASTQH